MVQRFEGMYGSMKFPEYTYKEYPKNIERGGKTFVAHSKGEELKIFAMSDEPPPPSSAEITKAELDKKLAEADAALQASTAEADALRAELSALKGPPKSATPAATPTPPTLLKPSK